MNSLYETRRQRAVSVGEQMYLHPRCRASAAIRSRAVRASITPSLLVHARILDWSRKRHAGDRGLEEQVA